MKKALVKCFVVAAVMALGSASLVVRAHGEADQSGKSGQKPKQTAADIFFRKAGNQAHADHVVNIDMSDTIRIKPARLTIRQGETVKFVVKNSDKDLHQIAIGIKADLKEHEQLMRAYPGMVEHDGSHMAYVAPGKTEEVVWQFTNVGEFNFGCTIPGYFEPGETGKIFVVSPRPSTQ